ncbi:MAG: DMT family transporter [Anaerolineales bacterium]|nr:DMT family transporter [Anaerolineales bacterium]
MQLTDKPHRPAAIAESLFVTIIWASSFIFVKIALNYMGPITIAGLRYFGAFIILLPFIIRNNKSSQPIAHTLWIRLAAIGISAYTIGNGALFWGLKYLSATTASFLMSLLPLLILLLGIIWLKETPSLWQILGVIISLIGSGLFFSKKLQADELLGVFIISIGLIGFALFGVLGRAMAKSQQVNTLSLTAIPLAVGGGVLMLIAFFIEGFPTLNLTAWSIVIWLATVNTAFAYILYNHALQVLSALEMNIMLNLSPLGTALFAWLLLDERLNIIQIMGMATVIIGVILVQQTGRRLKA